MSDSPVPGRPTNTPLTVCQTVIQVGGYPQACSVWPAGGPGSISDGPTPGSPNDILSDGQSSGGLSPGLRGLASWRSGQHERRSHPRQTHRSADATNAHARECHPHIRRHSRSQRGIAGSRVPHAYNVEHKIKTYTGYRQQEVRVALDYI